KPDVTMSVCPSGCVCQLLRAQGSNVTYAPLVRAGCGALKSGSIRTVPVKYSAGPRAEGSDPLRLSSILIPHDDHFAVAASDGATVRTAARRSRPVALRSIRPGEAASGKREAD